MYKVSRSVSAKVFQLFIVEKSMVDYVLLKYIYDDLKSIDDFYNWVRMYDSIKQSSPSIVIDIYGYSFHIISKNHIIVYIFMKLNESRDIYNYISDNNNWKPSIKYNNQYIPKVFFDYVL